MRPHYALKMSCSGGRGIPRKPGEFVFKKLLVQRERPHKGPGSQAYGRRKVPRVV